MGVVVLEKDPIVLPKIAGRGRKKGGGDNQQLLAKLQPGYSLTGVDRDKKNSIRTTAYRLGIKLKIRRIPELDEYIIQRLT